MNSPERIKKLLSPTQVVQYYLGQPVRSNRLGDWYKSPFRHERTASFLVSDKKGIHDFGTSTHYDIISFLQELLRIDFKSAIDKLYSDFSIVSGEQTSAELDLYLFNRREQDKEIKSAIDNWFNKTYIKICQEKEIIPTIIQHLHGEWDLKAYLYVKDTHLDNLIETFIQATDEDKVELWKDKKSIEKWI